MFIYFLSKCATLNVKTQSVLFMTDNYKSASSVMIFVWDALDPLKNNVKIVKRVT